ncbi:exo-alpha-sialidase [Arenibacter aquaticus]|uniref:exo-alpha-sialidase n=1 Tax=Arenibacter aquaticus TaxID=2489054 RepID=A0A430K4Y9_9FLAO|nr:sialidase family protein [Arenibacter aquaticus]RTE54106.1 exo-alpha-sialidase [Arenibacter aquaticus]
MINNWFLNKFNMLFIRINRVFLPLLFAAFLQCSSRSDEMPSMGDNTEVPDEIDFNTDGISYSWDTHTWKGLDDSLTYGIKKDGNLDAVRIVQGNRTSYSVDKEYYRVRIPVAEVTKSGTIIVVSEGRLGDNPAVPPGTDRDWDHVLISRSTDFGETWDTKVIYDGDNNTDFGAIAIVADKKHDGRIQILGTHQNGMLIMQSFDDGITWSEHHQSGPVIYSSESVNVRMRPNNGIQIMGENLYNGDFILGGITGYNTKTRMVILHYDFATDTWLEHDIMNVEQRPDIPEEITLIELESDSRNKIRIITRPSKEVSFKQQLVYDLDDNSHEGLGWANSRFPYVRCNQNARRYSSEYGNQTSRLIYSSTKNVGNNRFGGNISISYDEGGSWLTKQLVDDTVYFGYSQVLTLPDGSLGCIYEGTNSSGFNNSALMFRRFTLGWLTDGADFGFKN